MSDRSNYGHDPRLAQLEQDYRTLLSSMSSFATEIRGFKDLLLAELKPLTKMYESLKELVSDRTKENKDSIHELSDRLHKLEVHHAEHDLTVETMLKQVAELQKVSMSHKVTLAKWGFAGIVLLALLNAGLIKLFIGG